MYPTPAPIIDPSTIEKVNQNIGNGIANQLDEFAIAFLIVGMIIMAIYKFMDLVRHILRRL